MSGVVDSREAVAITRAPLQVDRAIAQVAPDDTSGAISTFVGLVRNENAGRRVEFLEYEAYEPLALRALQRIVDEVGEHWPHARVACHHRIGRLEIGEASIVIAAASPHRADAFAVCRYVIERVKQIVPIWKHEHFAGGAVWVEGATADPSDAASRGAALQRAGAPGFS